MLFPIHVSLEGGIGVGKSRSLECYSAKYQSDSVLTLKEPLLEYTNFVVKESGLLLNPLDLFYRCKSNALPTQLHILDCYKSIFVDLNKKIQPKQEIILSDRSVISTEVFTTNLFHQKHIVPLGFYYWQNQFIDAQQIKSIVPNAIYYMETDVETAYANIHRRNREMETSTDDLKPYLISLNETYDFILNKYEESGDIVVKRTKTYNLDDRVEEIHALIEQTYRKAKGL